MVSPYPTGGLGVPVDPYASPSAMGTIPQGGVRGFFGNNRLGLATIGANLMSGRWSNLGQNLPPAVAADMARTEKLNKENKTLAWLDSQGLVTPEIAAFLKARPDMAGEVVQTLFKAQIDAKTRARRSLVPVPLFNEKTGQWSLGQVTEEGTIEPFKTPEGTTYLPPVQQLNTGTTFTPVTKQGGLAPPGAAQTPIDVAGAAAETEKGTLRAKAQAALPGVQESVRTVTAEIDAVLADPALAEYTGWLQGALPDLTERAQRVGSRLDQIIGGSFLTAYDSLRGAGPIAVAEGEAAMKAYQRLSRIRMSDEDYRKALMDFRDKAQRMVEVARQKAGEAATVPAPGDGTVKAEDYFK